MPILEIVNEKEYSASSCLATNFVLSIANALPFFNHSTFTGIGVFLTKNLAEALSSAFTIMSSTLFSIEGTAKQLNEIGIN